MKFKTHTDIIELFTRKVFSVFVLQPDAAHVGPSFTVE